jgi:hypothetical protein
MSGSDESRANRGASATVAPSTFGHSAEPGASSRDFSFTHCVTTVPVA